MYSLKVREELDKTFSKLVKRDPMKLQIIHKKIKEILEDPQRFKNLRAPLNHWKRVHIDSHFVLVFSVDENTKTVTLEDYDHHDNIYK
jgi:YafQ family addiction module toxin component